MSWPLVRGVFCLARSGSVQATAVLDYGPPNSDKQLGVLPVVRDVLARLDLLDTIDRLCPIRRDAGLTHGQVIAALIANRVTEPAALVRVEDWAAPWAVEEILGTPAHLLNDDRIGRALEALAEQDETVVGSIGATAIREFGIDVSQLHGDMTSMSLYGLYNHPEAGGEYATPRFGHPKDGGSPCSPAPTTAAPRRSARSTRRCARCVTSPGRAGSCSSGTVSSSPTVT
ncbi:DUF4277 domain-containing protein [Frankia sp. Cj3]|uniref:DUF4277 domain-containing protein n=1 Tax=Frankia sp. Cj3 TaxID=2880976 RepID=UPI001EF68417|nr:DUF4277 domain-containing protein [Frankia sp. Cj3]